MIDSTIYRNKERRINSYSYFSTSIYIPAYLYSSLSAVSYTHLETAGAYYGTQKACRPLHIQMSLNSQHKVDIINTTLKEYRNLKVEVVVYDKVGKKIRSSQQKEMCIRDRYKR